MGYSRIKILQKNRGPRTNPHDVTTPIQVGYKEMSIFPQSGFASWPSLYVQTTLTVWILVHFSILTILIMGEMVFRLSCSLGYHTIHPNASAKDKSFRLPCSTP